MNQTNGSEAILHCRRLHNVYHTGDEDLEVLRDLDLDVWENEFTAITGESGCGKSTLLHLLGCLDEPTEGEIVYRGEDLSKLGETSRDRIRTVEFGFVFQFHHLMPEFNALENVSIPAMIAGQPAYAVRERAETLLRELNLGGRLTHKPAKLSGGELQRVAVARSLMNKPSILFMDEPTGNLDPAHSAELIELIRSQQQTKRLTVVMVTHDREIARSTDRHLQLRDGKLFPV